VLQVADKILQAAVAQDTAEGVGSGKIPSFTTGYSEGEECFVAVAASLLFCNLVSWMLPCLLGSGKIPRVHHRIQ
jgi:hypothetical protein